MPNQQKRKEKKEWWQNIDLKKLESRKVHLIDKAMDCDKERQAIENLLEFLENFNPHDL